MVDINVPGNRIREIRKQRGLSLEALAAKVGEVAGKSIHFTTIAKFERSQRQLSGEMLANIAQALDVSPEKLVSEVPTQIPVRMVPIIGQIAAGAWREAIHDPMGYLPAPVRGPQTFGLRPQGDSMDLIVSEGATIIVDPDDTILLDGKLYAIMNGDGETTFKRFRQSPPRFEPVSSNPEHEDIPIGQSPFTVIGRVVWQGSSL